MADKARNTTGASLRERAAVARRLTAEQQRAAREASEAARSAALGNASEKRAERKAKRAQKRAEKQQASERQHDDSSARTGRVAKRTAKGENFKEPARKRNRTAPATPRASIALGTPAKVLIAVLAVIVAIGVILYPPARSYYQTMRMEQHDQAVLDAMNARNEALRHENEELDTDEGIENQARTEFGWTKEDESAAVVSNIDDSDTESKSSLPEHVEPDDVKAPQTWYYSVLDVLFFVQQ